MNIVKGVADLIWRSSSAQTGEFTSTSAPGRFPLPARTISFSEVGDEAILKALWEKYLSAGAEAEKRKLLHIFLKQFLTIFRSWKPYNIGQVPEESSTTSTGEYTKNVGDMVVGCNFGHPSDVILVMIDEVSVITRVLTNNQLGFTKNMNITTESLMALDALTIATLSIHNCKVLGRYAGIQKLTTLLKAAVIQLKTIASTLPVDGSLLNTMVQNSRTLQSILVIVVSIICNFIDFPSSIEEKFLSITTDADSSEISAGIFTKSSAEVHSPISEAILSWHQVAVVSVMEAGGLNWLVEILRLMRRLILKEQWVEKSLQHSTLRALWSALADNPRGQNHFRSIGGLEVLLDGLGVQSINSLMAYDSSSSENRSYSQLQDVVNLHVLSLEVLREAVFGNFNNLQFLCENGRVQKFANSFCSLAFIIQDYSCFKASPGGDFVDEFNGGRRNASEECRADVSDRNQYHPSFVQQWKDYVARLSSALCHFLLEAKDIKIFSVQPNSSRNTTMMSPVYAELSLKWFTRVLLTVFPCIRACSNQEEIPSHLRIFALTMQQSVLMVFKRVLLSLPSLIDVFRAEGVWDFMFSETFFYFCQTPAEYYLESCQRDVPLMYAEGCEASSSVGDQVVLCEIGNFQVEVLALMDFAATLSGATHNLPECTVLLDALEQSACNPELAAAVGKTLLHILQLSTEKTVSSFKTLGAIPRLLKVASIQVHESKKFNANANPATEAVESCQNAEMSHSPMATQSWEKCLGVCIELFEVYFSVSEDAKYSILCNSLSISYIFDLFWEEGLRDLMLKYVLELMKVTPSSEEDKKAKVFLCSKYFETFTHLKERVEDFAGPSVKLLVAMRAMLEMDQAYYQALFREGECFLHVVSLLNGNLDADNGEKLVLNVLQTLTCLLSMNDASKAAFRALVGVGYQTFRSLLLDFYQRQPSEALLTTLLDMLVDGNFDLKLNHVIKNEDAILLYLSFLHKSSDSLQRCGLDLLLNMLRDSLSNRASCVRAGMLEFLLNWISRENNDTLCLKLAQLIQVIGGHSISGKDIRKIFAMLRTARTCLHDHSSSVLLTSMLAMMDEKGPTAFFDLNGINSGIIIKKPLQWPVGRGYSFTCWLRIESFPQDGPMALFSFLTETGRGCYAMLVKDKIIYESINQKRQCTSVNISIIRKKWHFISLVHSVGGAFSGGSQLKCYLDGALVCSEKCSYPKINEALTNCAIGTKLNPTLHEEPNLAHSVKECCPFLGQIGPTYLFSDAISSEITQGIFSLGPSYMYYFLDNENSVFLNKFFAGGVRDAKDGLASKIMFGVNAQASNNRELFNVSPTVESAMDKEVFQATVLVGTQLCSRRLLQEIIYCVGGLSVFFPLLVQCDISGASNSYQVREIQLAPITNGHLTTLTIKLIASTLDASFANQQQMLLLSGFSILGFLLQSVPAMQLNLETLSALKHLFAVVADGGLPELLMKDAISCIFLNPHIWVGAIYEVQRELYMFLIQQFDNDRTLLKSLCRLPRMLDIIRQFYIDSTEIKPATGSKAFLHAMADGRVRGKPDSEEIRKIRLLLSSLGEMSLRENITAADIKALVAFFETCQDVSSLEDILNMIMRAICEKQLLSSFLEQVHLVGGCVIFVNLLKRDYEPVRLLALQFIGRLLIGLPVEKKGSRFFSILVGRTKSLTEGHGKTSLDIRPIFSLISDRMFEFQQTDLLCVTLFDVLLGGASPKQVLRKHNQSDKQKSSKNNAEFFLPQVLPLIFRFLSGCEDRSSRTKIMGDLLDLLNSNPSNIEALLDNGWNDWLFASVKLDVIKNYRVKMQGRDDSEVDEKQFVMNIYSLVLCHLILCVKGGWQDLEETVNFLLIQSATVDISYQYFLRDIYEDLIQKLISLSDGDQIFVSLPCRDNILYLLKLVDEMLISEMDYRLPFPACRAKFPQFLELDDCLDFSVALSDALQGETGENISGSTGVQSHPDFNENEVSDARWNLYDKLWVLIDKINAKEPGKVLPRSSSLTVPSLSQRARGLVDSLNIPATEMAAAVSGGIGNALIGKPNRTLDKAMQLRGERCSRFVYRLTIFYLCRSSLERASLCVQHVITILPSVLAADDEQSKSRLQLFIWTLLAVRSLYGILDGGARFHVISSLIRETINSGKPMLVASIGGGDDLSELFASSNQWNTIFNFLQKDRLLGAVANEVKYINNVKGDKTVQLDGLQNKTEESIIADAVQKNALEEQIESSLQTILASDDFRRSSFQLSMEEEQHIIAEKWIHTLRLLTDERGPWSANPFPNSIVAHWKLDKTEDAWRRRQKLRRNYHFDEKLCHPSSVVSGEMTLPSTNESKFGLGVLALEKIKQFSLKGIQRITDEAFSEPIENEAQSSQEKISETDSSGTYSNVMTEKTEQDTLHDREEYTSLKESDNSEVLMIVPCVLVNTKRKLAGRLAIMKEFLNFYGEYLVEGTGGSSALKTYCSLGNFDSGKLEDLDSERSGLDENINSVNRDNELKLKKCTKRRLCWNMFKIKAVHWTRYLLRYTALEIFINSATPIFFNFDSQKVAKSVGSLIVATRNDCISLKGLKEKVGVISFVDRRLAQEMAETARESWRRREITNFEYLMVLNTLAGRSYCDITQYPVFPWVIADYCSENLDLKKSSTFRDLSKPVGALDAKRFEVFEDRYQNFTDPDIPSFYYGSHYSSMGIVLFYLLRLEPFTALHRNLQGGKFDHADRLFQSIEGTYKNCLSNTSDVKELIPEFFYMPEFLMNSNSYHFGIKQDGEPIGDVCLPPWAKGSPEEFINRNREALESEYVSSNLHHWIDLVFGYKQRGKPAVEAANIFYYLTYEGAVDLENMEDDLQRSAIEDQIANFGQTPIQIFRKKHPRRGPPIPISHPLSYAPGAIKLTSVVSSMSNSPSAVMYVSVLDSCIVTVNQGLFMSVRMWLTTQLQSGGNFTFSGSQDPFFGIGSDLLSPCKIGSHLAANFELGAQSFATLQTPSENFIISCGNWENSFQVISLGDGRVLQSVRYHKDIVSCVSVTADGSFLATASYDTTVMVWEILRVRTPRSRSIRTDHPLQDCIISEAPFHILCGHDDVISCLHASTELDLVISGSKDGTCIFHTLQTGKYVRSLRYPSGRPLSKLTVSRHGRIVLYADDLNMHLYSINGRHISSAESNGRLSSMELSCCGNFLVCAGDQGQIVVRSMNSLEVLVKYAGIGKPISSLTVTREECFIAGTKDGDLLVYSVENPQLHKSGLQKNSKSKSIT